MTIFAIGYEDLVLHEFSTLLKRETITDLADNRELPLSRKPGFSKSALCAAVRSLGIAYQHVRGVGCPNLVRQRYREDGDWKL